MYEETIPITKGDFIFLALLAVFALVGCFLVGNTTSTGYSVLTGEVVALQYYQNNAPAAWRDTFDIEDRRYFLRVSFERREYSCETTQEKYENAHIGDEVQAEIRWGTLLGIYEGCSIVD